MRRSIDAGAGMKKRLKISVRVVAAIILVAITVKIYEELQKPHYPKWPIVQGQLLQIPVQSVLPESTLEPPPDFAIQVWQYAREEYADASNENDARQKTLPLLQSIWQQWPQSSTAVKAKLFTLHLLDASHTLWLQQADELLQAAVTQPQLYLVAEYQQSLQIVATQMIKRLQQQDENDKAWSWCLRLRWLMPRIDSLAAECQLLLESESSLVRAPKESLKLVPASIELEIFPANKINDGLIEAVQNTISRPYDEDVLSAAIIQIERAGFHHLAKKLINEHVQIDPEHTYKIEAEIYRR